MLVVGLVAGILQLQTFVADVPDVTVTAVGRIGGERKMDEGKVMALYKAKWSQKKIADEMGCSQSKICQIIKANRG